MQVINRKDIKPALKKSEQTRHQTAAQYFLAGAKPFLIEQEIKIKKYVNLDIVKDNIALECKKKFEAMKQSLQERTDELRDKTVSDFQQLLDGLLLMSGAAIIILNNLSPQLVGFVQKYGNIAYDTLVDEFTQVRTESLRYADQFQNEAKEHMKYFGKILFKYIDIFFNRIKGNIFAEMLMIGAQKAGERANGAMWLILKVFGAFIHNDVRKRPQLEEFLKFGPKVTSEINDFETEFRSMTHQLISFQGVKAKVAVRQAVIETYGDEWSVSGYEDVERVVNLGGEIEERIKRQMYALDERLLNVSKGMAADIHVESIFSQLKSPSETESYKAALELIQNTTLEVGKNVPTVKAKELIIAQMPEVYSEACQRIERYLKENEDRYDETYQMIRTEYSALKNKSDIERFYLIRWILYSTIMDTRKQELYKITLGSLEQQNYTSDTILNRTLSRMRSANQSNQQQIDAITSDLRAGRISVTEFTQKIDQILDEYEVKSDENGKMLSNYKIFKNLINRNDARETFTPHKVINQINLLKESIQKAAQVQQGAESSMVHNMNEYGFGRYSATEYDNDGRVYQHVRESHKDAQQIVPIVEANERIIQEYIILRQSVNDGRKRRRDLLQQLHDGLAELKDGASKIYGLNNTDG